MRRRPGGGVEALPAKSSMSGRNRRSRSSVRPLPSFRDCRKCAGRRYRRCRQRYQPPRPGRGGTSVGKPGRGPLRGAGPLLTGTCAGSTRGGRAICSIQSRPGFFIGVLVINGVWLGQAGQAASRTSLRVAGQRRQEFARGVADGGQAHPHSLSPSRVAARPGRRARRRWTGLPVGSAASRSSAKGGSGKRPLAHSRSLSFAILASWPWGRRGRRWPIK